jgi:hypothetical protein
MILGEADMYASLLLPGQRDLITELPVSIVGFPTVVNRRVLSFNLARFRPKNTPFVIPRFAQGMVGTP